MNKLFLALAAACLLVTGAIADERIQGVPAEQVTPVKLDRLGHILQWEFALAEPELKRVDVRLFLGNEELVHTWHTTSGLQPTPVKKLAVIIDFLTDLSVPKWRFHSALVDSSGGFNRVIDLPAWTGPANLKLDSWGPVAGIRDDGRYQLADLAYQDGAIRKMIPLRLEIILNGDAEVRSDSSKKSSGPKMVYSPPPDSLTPELIAAAFGWSGQLTRTEVKKVGNTRAQGNPIWSLSFSGPVGTFAPVNVTAFEGGTFLGGDYKKKFDEALAKYDAIIESRFAEQARRIETSEDPLAREVLEKQLATLKAKEKQQAPLRMLALPNGQRAYLQLLGFGPGGASYGFITKTPDNSQDIMIVISQSYEGEGVLRDTPETRAYVTAMHERPEELLETAGRRILEAILK